MSSWSRSLKRSNGCAIRVVQKPAEKPAIDSTVLEGRAVTGGDMQVLVVVVVVVVVVVIAESAVVVLLQESLFVHPSLCLSSEKSEQTNFISLFSTFVGIWASKHLARHCLCGRSGSNIHHPSILSIPTGSYP